MYDGIVFSKVPLVMEHRGDLEFEDFRPYVISELRCRLLREFIRKNIDGAVFKKLSPELKKILERWTIDALNSGYDPWAPFTSSSKGDSVSINYDRPVDLKAVEEMVEKGVDRRIAEEAFIWCMTRSNVIGFIRPIKYIIRYIGCTTRDGDKSILNSYRVTVYLDEIDAPQDQNGLKDSSNINFSIDKTKLAKLNVLIDLQSRYDIDSKIELARATLRYGALLSDSQQWSIPGPWYTYLETTFDINLEGFASPFNRHLPSFCSIFREDAIFGSIGNFFEVDLTNYRSVINPPFIENLLNRVAETVKSTLEKVDASNSRFLTCVVVPGWSDATFYKTLTSLSNSEEWKNKSKVIRLKARSGYFYESNFKEGIKKINASFSSVWFCFGVDSKAIQLNF